MKIMDRIFFRCGSGRTGGQPVGGLRRVFGCQQHRLFRCVQRSRFLCGRIRRGGF